MEKQKPGRRFAQVMALITLIAAIALPIVAAVIWIFLDRLAPIVDWNVGGRFNLAEVGTGGRIAGFLVSFAGAGIQSFGLLSLRRTFLEAAADRALSQTAVMNFRRFAWVAMAMVFIGIAQKTAYILIFSVSDPGQPNQIAIGFGSNELAALFTAALLVFAAHVFAAGRRADEENAAFL